MSMTAATLQRLQQRAAQADHIIAQLRTQLLALKKTVAVELCREEEAKLQSENSSLRQELIILKQKLCSVETSNGLKQVSLPNATLSKAAASCTAAKPAAPAASTSTSKDESKPATQQPQAQQPQQKKKEKKKAAPKEQKPAEPAAPIDVSRLNMKIGHIVSAKKHPDADGLYVEDVDLGEGRNRTIVSGLVKHVPLEEMQDRYAIFLTNLKPAKMRGIMSEGMIMCASTPEKVEIINPPKGVAIGERVTVAEFPGAPDDMLNPKKKIWEQIQPDLHVNTDGAATYKGGLWTVGDKKPCTVPTMRDSGIK